MNDFAGRIGNQDWQYVRGFIDGNRVLGGIKTSHSLGCRDERNLSVNMAYMPQLCKISRMQTVSV
jgi:hypothetical protein